MMIQMRHGTTGLLAGYLTGYRGVYGESRANGTGVVYCVEERLCTFMRPCDKLFIFTSFIRPVVAAKLLSPYFTFYFFFRLAS